MTRQGRRRLSLPIVCVGLALGLCFGAAAAPIADSGGPYIIDEGEALALDASGTTGATSYSWDLDDDGTFGDRTGPTPTIAWNDVEGFGMDDDGTYTIWLSACDATSCQTVSTTVAVMNVSPSAGIAPPGSINEGDQLNLSATGSDPSSADDATLTFAWDLDDDGFYDDDLGATVTVSWSTLESLGRGDGPATHDIGVQVSDDDGGSTIASAEFTLVNLPPHECDAGGDYLISEGDALVLSGSGADKAAADVLSFFWDLDANGFYTESPPNELPDGLESADVSVEWDTLDGLGTNDGDADGTDYTLTLKVADDDGGEREDTATLAIMNTPPTMVSHGGPYVIDEGDSVTLDPAATDPSSADPLTFNWDLEDDGGDVYDDATGDPETVAWSTLIALGTPIDDDGVYAISVRVDDGDGGTDELTTTLSVVNTPPTASIDPGTYAIAEGDGVTLHGVGTDPSPPDQAALVYEWDLDDDGQFDDKTGPDPTLTWTQLRALGIDEGSATGTDYTVSLRVSDDDGGTDIDTGTITVTNTAPTAHANGSYSIDEGSSLTLNAGGSSDPGADTLTYSWDLDDDSDYDDLVTTSATPTVTWGQLEGWELDDDGTYNIGLEVTDGDGGSDTDATTVTILNLDPVPNAGGPYHVNEGEDVELSGSVTDPNSNDAIVSLCWDTDGNSACESPSMLGLTPTLTWDHLYADIIDLNQGTHTIIALWAEDDDGGSAWSSYVDITVHNVEPTATDAGGPYSINEGDSVTLTGSGTDPNENDDLICGWDLDNDGTYDVESAPFDEGDSKSTLVSWATLETLHVNDGDSDGTDYTIKMAVKDDVSGWSAPIAGTLTITNTAPTASADVPAGIAEGEDVVLVGSGSDPSSADTLEYAWDLDWNLTVDTSWSTSTTRTVDWATLYGLGLDDDGEYPVALWVRDEDGGESWDWYEDLKVSITNTPPTAEANGAYEISEGNDLTVNAAGTTDPGNDELTYYWGAGLVSDPPSYDLATSTDPLGVADITWAQLESKGITDGGGFTIFLRVEDDDGGEGTDTAYLIVGNVEPSAEAGGPYSIAEGDDLHLDGDSTAPGSKEVAWDLDGDLDFDDGVAAVDDPTIDWDTLVAAEFDDEGTYSGRIAFRVQELTGSPPVVEATHMDTANLIITNTAPTIVLDGSPYTIDEGTGFTATSTVTDPSPVDEDRMDCNWDLENNGVFKDAIAVQSFADPTDFSTDVSWADLLDLSLASDSTPLTIALSAYDGTHTTVASTTLTITNLAPTIGVVDEYTIAEGESLRLDARTTTDPGSDPLTFTWDLDHDGSYADGVTGSYPLVDWATLFTHGIDDDDHSPDHSSPYTIGLHVDDGEGGVSESVVTVIVTNTPPSPDADGPYDIYEGTWASANAPGPPFAPLVLNASASTDPGADTLHYAWNLDNDGTYETDAGTSASFSVDWPALEAIGVNDDGEYTIAVQVDDEDGGVTVDTARLTIHNSRPIVTSAGGPYEINEGDSLTLTGAATDPSSADTFTYVWDIDGKPTGEPDFDDGTHGFTKTIPWDVLVLFGLGDGNSSHTVRLTVMDDDGLSDYADAPLAVVNTAPTITECPDPLTTYHTDPVTGLGGSFTDPGTDTWTGTVNWADGSAVEPIAIDPDAKTYALPDHTYSSAPPGLTEYDVDVTVADDDAGEDTCTFTISVIHDVTPPIVILTTVPSDPSSDVSPTFEWTGTDDFALPEEIQYSYRLDGGDWSEWSTETSVIFERIEEGYHLFEIRGKDLAGNISDPVQYEWLTDYSKPLITVVVPQPGTLYILNSLVAADWQVRDLLTSVVTINASHPDGSPIDTSKIGIYDFFVEAIDIAGNSDLTSFNFYVGPAVSPIVPPGAGDGPAGVVAGDIGAGVGVEWSFLTKPIPTHLNEDGEVVRDPVVYGSDETIGLSFTLVDALGSSVVDLLTAVFVDVVRIVQVGFLEEYEYIAIYNVPYDPVLGQYVGEIPIGVDEWWALTPGEYFLGLSIRAVPLQTIRIATIPIVIIQTDG